MSCGFLKGSADAVKHTIDEPVRIISAVVPRNPHSLTDSNGGGKIVLIYEAVVSDY
jgi:hypothetical protein